MTKNIIITIGRAENIALPELTEVHIPARIDTGARTSAIWASSVEVKDDRLEVIFFGPSHPSYTGKKVYFSEFTHGMVASSIGATELRYRVKLLVKLGGKNIRATFSLANREKQAYSVLIGRNVLRGKFMVNVKLGSVHAEAEKQRSHEIQAMKSDKEVRI